MACATFGGGCFWCLEAVFTQLSGISEVVSGYMGGKTASPTYEAVCTGATGHAEVVQILFDQTQIDFWQLLEVFFAVHDPTTVNRQGADVGTQYRSVIFYHDDEQKRIAQNLISDLQARKVYASPIMTQLEVAGAFYPAEDYHQSYFQNNPLQPYCGYVVAPKVGVFRERFRAWLKPEYR